MFKRVLVGLVLVLMLLGAQSGWCDSQSSEEQVLAVQNRIFHRNHEIDLSVGYIADDDFFHVYPVGIGYTFHFNDHIAWEVCRAQYMFNVDKDLKETLQDEFGVQPEEFAEQQYMLHTHLVYSPLYGKHAFMNRSVINNEIYFFAGPGTVHYEWDYSSGESRSEDAFSLSFGMGLKYFLSKSTCLNFEIRDLVNLREDDTENNIYFGVGLGYRFNLAPRKVEEDPTMKKLDKILNDE
jgi:outer membrane beta-barrel protein